MTKDDTADRGLFTRKAKEREPFRPTHPRAGKIVALERHATVHRFWVAHYDNGDARLKFAFEAVAIYPGALDMEPGERVELKKV